MPNFFYEIKMDSEKLINLNTTEIIAIIALILSCIIFIPTLVMLLKTLSKVKCVFIGPFFTKKLYNLDNDIALMIINKSNFPISVISVMINNQIIKDFPVYLQANETKIIPLEYIIEDESAELSIEVITTFKEFKFKATPNKPIKPQYYI